MGSLPEHCSHTVTSIISLHLTRLLYLSVTLSLPLSCYTNLLQSPFHPKTKITNFKQIYPTYQLYNFNTSYNLN